MFNIYFTLNRFICVSELHLYVLGYAKIKFESSENWNITEIEMSAQFLTLSQSSFYLVTGL